MTDLQAAIGVVQMARLDGILARRRAIAARDDAALATLRWLQPPIPDDGHSYQSYVCLLADEARGNELIEPSNNDRGGELIAHLERSRIGARPGTHAPVRMSFYRSKYSLSEKYPSRMPSPLIKQASPLPLVRGDERRRSRNKRSWVSALREADPWVNVSADRGLKEGVSRDLRAENERHDGHALDSRLQELLLR